MKQLKNRRRLFSSSKPFSKWQKLQLRTTTTTRRCKKEKKKPGVPQKKFAQEKGWNPDISIVSKKIFHPPSSSSSPFVVVVVAKKQLTTTITTAITSSDCIQQIQSPSTSKPISKWFPEEEEEEWPREEVMGDTCKPTSSLIDNLEW